MKILVNTPNIHELGGVSNHYLGLKKFWTERVVYNSLGSKRWRKWLMPFTTLKLMVRLLFFRPDVVLLNPSLGSNAMRRDFFYLNLCRFFGFKVAIFIHGFNWNYAKKADKEWLAHNLNKASLIFVLAEAFRKEIQSWGVSTPIELSTTKVDDALLEGCDVEKERTGKVKNILFLARVEKAKGVFIAIDTYRILKEKYPFLTLTIAGDGSALPQVKKMVAEEKIPDVIITGRVSGQALIDAYKNADLSSSSSSYGEGMPTSVLEAMAFGLPIFTRNVGGLVDFFEDGKMGYITDSLDAADFAQAMIPYIEDPELTKRVSIYNAQYAREHFLASSVAKRVEDTIKKYV